MRIRIADRAGRSGQRLAVTAARERYMSRTVVLILWEVNQRSESLRERHAPTGPRLLANVGYIYKVYSQTAEI